MTFDHEQKRKTMENVRRELVRTGELLQVEGCDVKVVRWNGQKGCDDYIVNNGPDEWAKRLDLATPLAWTAQQHYSSEYRKMGAWVQKQHGPAPTPDMLDVALAIVLVDRSEKGEILRCSPQVKGMSQKETRNYLQQIQDRASALRQTPAPSQNKAQTQTNTQTIEAPIQGRRR
jgi:DNA primase